MRGASHPRRRTMSGPSRTDEERRRPQPVRRLWPPCLAATFVAMGPAAAVAEEARAAPSAAGVQDIVVTARKRAEHIQQVPMSISAFSGETLQARGVNDVLDLPKITPNLRLDTVSQMAGVSLRIRGVGASSNAAIDPSVAPYIDGVYIPRPGAILSSFLDVDRVEVLRGPQGT